MNFKVLGKMFPEGDHPVDVQEILGAFNEEELNEAKRLLLVMDGKEVHTIKGFLDYFNDSELGNANIKEALRTMKNTTLIEDVGEKDFRAVRNVGKGTYQAFTLARKVYLLETEEK